MSLSAHEVEALAHDQLNKLELHLKLLEIAKQLNTQLTEVYHQLEGIADVPSAIAHAKATLSAKIADSEPTSAPAQIDVLQ